MGFFGGKLPGSDVNFASQVKNGMSSSVVTSALCWMMRTFPEAPLVTQKLVEEKWETQPGHALTNLLGDRTPSTTASCSGRRRSWTSASAKRSGSRSETGRRSRRAVVGAARPHLPEGEPEDRSMLDYYDYRPGYSEPLALQPSDVVHFRFGRDPNNILRGFSPLAAVMREVYTDDQAANFTAAILKNMGVIGVIIAPEVGTLKQEAVDKLKDDFQQKFTGDKRGSAMVVGGPMKAQVLQYNLSGFDVAPVRDIAEERVCAALGIPAAVIGFGTGLQQTKVGATMREMVKLAWQGGIEPIQQEHVRRTRPLSAERISEA
jgi:hypothetical protein